MKFYNERSMHSSIFDLFPKESYEEESSFVIKDVRI